MSCIQGSEYDLTIFSAGSGPRETWCLGPDSVYDKILDLHVMTIRTHFESVVVTSIYYMRSTCPTSREFTEQFPVQIDN